MTTTFDLLVGHFKNVPIRKLVSALQRDGFEWEYPHRGSHRRYLHSDGRGVVVPYHKGSDTMPRGVLKQFLRQTQWNKDDAQRLGLAK